jgi:hypothetical protein
MYDYCSLLYNVIALITRTTTVHSCTTSLTTTVHSYSISLLSSPSGGGGGGGVVIWVAFLSLLNLSPRLSLYVSSLCSLSFSSLHLLCLFTLLPISLLPSLSMSLHSAPYLSPPLSLYTSSLSSLHALSCWCVLYLLFTLITLFSHLTHALFPLITPSRGAVRRYAIKDSGSMLLVVDPDRLARVSPLIGKIGFKTILCRSDATASGYAATATAGGERVSEACIHGIVASSHQLRSWLPLSIHLLRTLYIFFIWQRGRAPTVQCVQYCTQMLTFDSWTGINISSAFSSPPNVFSALLCPLKTDAKMYTALINCDWC